MLLRGGVVAIGLIAAVAVASCGGGSDIRYSDKQIIDKLNLRDDKAAGVNAYLLGHDEFCAVSKKLLNDSDEVSSASDGKQSLVITSREGNVGVIGIPVFPRDCKDVVQKKLNRLDPAPKEG
ncbi:MAG: hypothetical protein ACJ75R_07545 [Solirubrobacterales bacterium]